MVYRHDALFGRGCGQDDDKRAFLARLATDNDRVDLDRTPSSSARLHRQSVTHVIS